MLTHLLLNQPYITKLNISSAKTKKNVLDAFPSLQIYNICSDT